jgi:hypothetical protein
MKIKLEDLTNIVVNKYWVSNEENTLKGKYVLGKNEGWATIGLGNIKLGDEEEVKKQIKQLCNRLREVI